MNIKEEFNKFCTNQGIREPKSAMTNPIAFTFAEHVAEHIKIKTLGDIESLINAFGVIDKGVFKRFCKEYMGKDDGVSN